MVHGTHSAFGMVRRAYARADNWEERVRMIAWWTDRSDEMQRGGVVIAMRG